MNKKVIHGEFLLISQQIPKHKGAQVIETNVWEFIRKNTCFNASWKNGFW
jgi:hypothetical protein